MSATAREATSGDAAAIARIYNEGIADRASTFETRERTAEDVLAWFDGVHPIVVVEDAGGIGAVAWTTAYSRRECYRGVAEFSVYVARARRGRGLGRMALEALAALAGRRGYWKLLGKVFAENAPSRTLMRRCGFSEVGVHRRHSRLDGRWIDIVLVERLLGEAAM